MEARDVLGLSVAVVIALVSQIVAPLSSIWWAGMIVSAAIATVALTDIMRSKTNKVQKNAILARPDMNISDAIDYIVNDSRTIFNRPYRPPTPKDFPPGTRMQVINPLPKQAQQKLQSKINTGDITAWGLRQIDVPVTNRQFETSLREIPPSYWDDIRLDFQSARFYRGPYSQTLPIQGRKATHNWADIKVSQAQLEAHWPKKPVIVRIYNKIRGFI